MISIMKPLSLGLCDDLRDQGDIWKRYGILMIGDLMVTSGWYHGGHGCGGAIIDAWMRLAYVEIYSFKLQNPQWFSMSLNCCCQHIKLGIRLKKENIVEFCGNLHGRAQRLGFAITTVWKEQPNFWGLKMAEALAKLRNHLPSAKLT